MPRPKQTRREAGRRAQLLHGELLTLLAGQSFAHADLQRTLWSLNVAILVTNDDFIRGPHILYASPSFSTMSGYELTELYGQSPRLLQGQQTDLAQARSFRRTLQRRGLA